jgi:hypothetical protein
LVSNCHETGNSDNFLGYVHAWRDTKSCVYVSLALIRLATSSGEELLYRGGVEELSFIYEYCLLSK